MLASFGVLQVFFSIIFFFLMLSAIMLVFRVVVDIFRDHQSSGGSKVLWVLFVIVAPFLGAFVYIVVKGKDMAGREVAQLEAQQAAAQQYIREAAGTASPVDELHRLADLKDRGVIDDAEFAALKAKLIG
jgi:cytochrome bd-type quinol oxidase subunit 2